MPGIQQNKVPILTELTFQGEETTNFLVQSFNKRKETSFLENCMAFT